MYCFISKLRCESQKMLQIPSRSLLGSVTNQNITVDGNVLFRYVNIQDGENVTKSHIVIKLETVIGLAP
jgi:hypothetical protein